jgi:hypothetical protein
MQEECTSVTMRGSMDDGVVSRVSLACCDSDGMENPMDKKYLFMMIQTQRGHGCFVERIPTLLEPFGR